MARLLSQVGTVLLAGVLVGCASAGARPAKPAVAAAKRPAPPVAATRVAPPPAVAPASTEVDGQALSGAPDPATVPDAVPVPVRVDTTSRPYQINGRTYVPQTEDLPTLERGLASWYGRRFHGRRTASGEVYDMHAMTAAHPTLPLPSYALVRNPANGREVVVRINDRGPFHPGRIIDLSHVAAVKLGVNGLATVEVRRLTNHEIRTGEWRRDAGPAEGWPANDDRRLALRRAEAELAAAELTRANELAPPAADGVAPTLLASTSMPSPAATGLSSPAPVAADASTPSPATAAASVPGLALSAAATPASVMLAASTPGRETLAAATPAPAMAAALTPAAVVAPTPTPASAVTPPSTLASAVMTLSGPGPGMTATPAPGPVTSVATAAAAASAPNLALAAVAAASSVRPVPHPDRVPAPEMLLAALPPAAGAAAEPQRVSTAAAPSPQRAASSGGIALPVGLTGYWVQLGAFRLRDGAESFRRRVATELAWLGPVLSVLSDADLHRLQAGPYPSRDQAHGVAQRLREALRLAPVIVERQ